MTEEGRPTPARDVGWFAYPPGADEPRDHDETPSVTGPEIRFMWDYSVSVPLWADGGLLPDDPDWLGEALGLSADLVAELTAWGNAMEELDSRTSLGDQQAYRELASRAAALVEELRAQLAGRYTVRYVPW